jgi:hypothetical protein
MAVMGLLPLLLQLPWRRRWRRLRLLVGKATAAQLLPLGGHAVSTSAVTGLLEGLLLLQLLQLPWRRRRWWLRLLVAKATAAQLLPLGGHGVMQRGWRHLQLLMAKATAAQVLPLRGHAVLRRWWRRRLNHAVCRHLLLYRRCCCHASPHAAGRQADWRRCLAVAIGPTTTAAVAGELLHIVVTLAKGRGRLLLQQHLLLVLTVSPGECMALYILGLEARCD